jgi:hypothetical protein
MPYGIELQDLRLIALVHIRNNIWKADIAIDRRIERVASFIKPEEYY